MCGCACAGLLMTDVLHPQLSLILSCYVKGDSFFLKNPFFLFLVAYIRVSEVSSKCKTPQKHKTLSPAHSHPPCWTDEASFWWKCSAVSFTEEHLPSSSSLRGYKSPVDKLYLRLMFQQS